MRQSLALLTLVFSAGGFVLCGWDKRQARRHHRRIAEKTLFLIGLLMGAWGIGLGMIVFHHKVSKPSFYRIVFLEMLLNAIVIILALSSGTWS